MRVHVILLDNRYEFDKRSKDRLGQAQWKWLDKALETEADLTLIGTGVQILPERAGVIFETYRWPSKKPLFDLLKKHKKDRVLLMSGDVHHAAFFTNQCRSLTGQTELHEVTSSGLSHHIGWYIPFASRLIDLVTPSWHTDNEPVFVDYNYG